MQVLGRDGHSWLDVPLLPGAFVVNGGELLELASSGAFVAATHRVTQVKTHTAPTHPAVPPFPSRGSPH